MSKCKVHVINLINRRVSWTIFLMKIQEYTQYKLHFRFNTKETENIFKRKGRGNPKGIHKIQFKMKTD